MNPSTDNVVRIVGYGGKRMNKHASTHQSLIDAFWELYTQKRIDKITVREITAKAGCNRGTFYEYFLDVYDVLEQIENGLIPEIDELPPLQASFISH